MSRLEATWDVTCGCGRVFGGTRTAAQAWFRRHCKHDLCPRRSAALWTVTCVCGWTHDGGQDECRRALKDHRTVRDYQAPPLFD